VAAMAVDRLRLLNQPTSTLKLTRPKVPPVPLGHNGAALRNNLPLVVLHQHLLEQATTGLADFPTSTPRHNPRIRTTTEESPSEDLLLPLSVNLVLSRTSRCEGDTLSLEVPPQPRPVADLRQQLLVTSMGSPLHPPRKAQLLRPNEELPIPTGAVLRRQPRVLRREVLMGLMHHLMVPLLIDRRAALEVRSDLMIIGFPLQRQLTCRTRGLRATPLIILRALPQVLLKMFLTRILGLVLMLLRSALTTARRQWDPSACVSGKRSQLPRSKPTRRTAHA
jgi:hypothetical protein